MSTEWCCAAPASCAMPQILHHNTQNHRRDETLAVSDPSLGSSGAVPARYFWQAGTLSWEQAGKMAAIYRIAPLCISTSWLVYKSNGNPCHWDPCRPIHHSCGLSLYVLPVMSISQQGESHQDWEGIVKSAHGSTISLQSFPYFCSLEVDLQRPQGLLTAHSRTLLQEPGGTKL